MVCHAFYQPFLIYSQARSPWVLQSRIPCISPVGLDDYLLQEILFNPYTHDQVSQIRTELKELLEIIDQKDAAGMKGYLTKIRNNVKRDIEIKK